MSDDTLLSGYAREMSLMRAGTALQAGHVAPLCAFALSHATERCRLKSVASSRAALLAAF